MEFLPAALLPRPRQRDPARRGPVFPGCHRFPPIAFGPNRERCHALTFILRYRGSIDLCVEISSNGSVSPVVFARLFRAVR